MRLWEFGNNSSTIWGWLLTRFLFLANAPSCVNLEFVMSFFSLVYLYLSFSFSSLGSLFSSPSCLVFSPLFLIRIFYLSKVLILYWSRFFCSLSLFFFSLSSLPPFFHSFFSICYFNHVFESFTVLLHFPYFGWSYSLNSIFKKTITTSNYFLINKNIISHKAPKEFFWIRLKVVICPGRNTEILLRVSDEILFLFAASTFLRILI